MALYLMLTTLTEKGVQTLNSNPARLREVNRDIEELGARILHQWASLGEYDFVNVVEAPDDLTIARVSVALGGLATLTMLVFVTQIVISLLLQGFADNSERAAAFLAGLVLSPVLFFGAALLYVDQAARVGTTRAERLALRFAPRDST